MRIVVAGSIATDHLMTFPGRFADQLVAEHLEEISLSFLADDLVVRRGGAGANIAIGLARLGHAPVLLGAAGADFAATRTDLEREGVDCRFLLLSATRHTARFICTTDSAGNQIATFYPGAMAEARNLVLRPVAERLGGLDLVLISPDDPEAMVRHTDECRDLRYAFAADPSQQLARMDGESVRRLVEGARYLFTNAYERALLCKKTGWSESDVLRRVDYWISTHGRDGVRIEQAGLPAIEVPAVPAAVETDPTGVGDAFRAGFLAAVAWGMSLNRAAQVGCALATTVLEVAGPQDYRLDPGEFVKRLAVAYGPEAAEEIKSHMPLHLRAGAQAR
ncbi:kinase [Microbispora rosea subsp. aerata]|nr:carbohydrate kinase family protein [Microbispora rosea]GGO03196.1 kinase [Microbispora rosea subsp. aerata]GIH54470.1 kinase [Microbispora rosea subsp. aerata]GLJ82736.1 kinase [Microbispora rosea subsp. aerata]